MKKFFLIVMLLLFFPITMFGKIVLPSIFADNMVLQQNSDVALWGWSDAYKPIKIVASWNTKDTIKVTPDKNAFWKTSIKTIAAGGGPYYIKIISDDDNLAINNVMLGEVWICSGQSNMEMSVNWGIINGEEEAAKANNPNIRIFHVPKVGAEYPQQMCNAIWTVCSPETMRKTSAVAYFFARKLQQKLNVPVGIIVSAWGGTPAEVWIERTFIENDSVLNKNKARYNSLAWPNNPGTLYNSMIAPIVPYGIAGVIWYQGESNCENYAIYSKLMKTMVDNWRTSFKKEFPFYFVQIAPFDYGDKGTSEFVREQQEIASKIIPNSGMVVINDLVDNIKDIHPKDKLNVGVRLANYALAENYKQNIGAYKSPNFKSMKIEKGKIRLTFNNVLTGLKSTGKNPKHFLIAGDDHKYVTATAKIEDSTIVVWSKEVRVPVAVRFCFDDTTMSDVFSTEDLPLAPFRTDK